MKTIVAGSRTILDYETVRQAIKHCGFTITEIVSGTAKGPDKLGEKWAAENNIPIKRFPSNWDEYGKAAGYKRNQKMAGYADALIAIWDGKSKGTLHMINLAKKAGLKVFVSLHLDT